MSDYLPIEVVREILLRLPVKPLLRATSVSTLWKSVITSPDFIDDHLKISSSTTRHLLLLKCWCTKKNPRIEEYTFYAEYPFYADDGTPKECTKYSSPFKPYSCMWFVGACDGLICLLDDRYLFDQAVFLWNPSIRRFLALPVLPCSNEIETSVTGFGFDLKRNDYKVVRIAFFMVSEESDSEISDSEGSNYPYMVEVYTPRTGCWQSVPAALPSDMTESMFSHVYLNGFCHWIGSLNSDGRNALVSFDLGDDVFRLMEFPEELAKAIGRPSPLHICLLHNMMSAICEDRAENVFTVWTMAEYGVEESWTKRYIIAVNGQGDVIEGVGRILHRFQGNGCDELESRKTVSFTGYNVESLLLLDNDGSRGDSELRENSAGVTRVKYLALSARGSQSLLYTTGNLLELLVTG